MVMGDEDDYSGKHFQEMVPLLAKAAISLAEIEPILARLHALLRLENGHVASGLHNIREARAALSALMRQHPLLKTDL